MVKLGRIVSQIEWNCFRDYRPYINTQKCVKIQFTDKILLNSKSRDFHLTRILTRILKSLFRTRKFQQSWLTLNFRVTDSFQKQESMQALSALQCTLHKHPFFLLHLFTLSCFITSLHSHKFITHIMSSRNDSQPNSTESGGQHRQVSHRLTEVDTIALLGIVLELQPFKARYGTVPEAWHEVAERLNTCNGHGSRVQKWECPKYSN